MLKTISLKSILSFSTLLLVIFSCNKDGHKVGSEIIFGTYSYIDCTGEKCVETYLLDYEELLEDTLDNVQNYNNLEFEKLSKKKFERAQVLRTVIPREILGLNSVTFGAPDSDGQGGIYLQIKSRRFHIDQDKEKVPDFLHDFIDELLLLVEEL